jgi:predicted dienelactone hydrolase
MDPASLRAIRVPALVIAGAEDPVAPPASNADVIAANIPSARLRTLQSAHYTFLSLCGFGGWWSLPGFCRDPQGVDRAAAHEAAIALAIRFFDDELRWPEN